MIDEVKSWCERQQASLLHGLDLMERGVMHTSEQRDGGALRDTTAETIADYQRKISEIEDLQRMIAADKP